MNVLFLDKERVVRKHYESFLKEGRLRSDWQPIFLRQLDGSAPPHEWIDEVFCRVIQAEAIVCFGDYSIILQFGDRAEDLVDTLIRKARNGVPFFLQLVRFTENEGVLFNGRGAGESLRSLFKAFDFSATRIKVDMTLTHTLYNKSTSLGYFRKTDGALRDPHLFKGVDQVLVSQPSLINFAGEAFPIIDASEAVNRFVDDGDWLTQSLEGTLPAVGIVRQPSDEYQLILSGSYFGDPTETLSGRNPGIDENRQFAVNVITALSGAAKTSANIQQRCYFIFNRLERSLGKLILDVIPQDDLWRCMNPRTRDALTVGGQMRYEKADFGHLCHIVKENWVQFRCRFNGMEKQDVLDLLFGVAKGARRLLAHPHRAEQSSIRFTDEDEAVLQRALRIIERAFGAQSVT
ncbi:hypothetical protein [Thiohalocapsa sp. ML1]|jgi:hypothetical protein|uniref:hypothetical protein n=1 Tax=Thiohalocapsa sp. ML1 TaxID=1431688 RepID=UPI0012E37708|nr:hypothetical protein [Thiohalocapsa sp. ML1]